MIGKMKARNTDPKRSGTIEGAWRLFRDVDPLHAHRGSFIAGAAWALGKIEFEARRLIEKEIREKL